MGRSVSKDTFPCPLPLFYDVLHSVSCEGKLRKEETLAARGLEADTYVVLYPTDIHRRIKLAGYPEVRIG